jgi:hypothetical protein
MIERNQKMKFDFTKNRTIDDLNKVPANCQAFYEKAEEEEDGGYNLRTDPQTTAAVAVITGQNKALVAVRQEVREAKEAKGVDLSPLSAYGSTVEEITTSVTTKIEELSAAASGKESDVAQRIAGIKKEHGEAVAALTATKDKEITATKEQLNAYMLDTSIMNAGAGWQGLNPKLVAPFAKKQMTVAEVDGKPRVVVVGADGEARYSTSPERAGELMNAEELLVEMSEDKTLRQLFPSTQASTGGGAQETTRPGVRRPDATKNMNPAQKISHGLANQKKK